MVKEARKITGDPSMEFGAWWRENKKGGNKFGELFMDNLRMPEEIIEHEIIHIIFDYLRYKNYLCFMYKWNPLEEELAHIYPYINQQIKCIRGANRCLVRKASYFFLQGKRHYRWHDYTPSKNISQSSKLSLDIID
jgi:hypothetical protein